MTDDHKTDTSHQAPEIPLLFGQPGQYDADEKHWFWDFGPYTTVTAEVGIGGYWAFHIITDESGFSGPDLREAEIEIEKELRMRRTDLLSLVGTEAERKIYLKHSRAAYFECLPLTTEAKAEEPVSPGSRPGTG